METVRADEAGLAAAARTLNAGGVAVIPTDTVYGLAARPDCADAVRRLYTIKGRAEQKPIALLAADADAAVTETAEEPASEAEESAVEADAEAEQEAEAETEEPALSGDALEVTTAVEADMLENEALFNELLAKAITRTNEKQFEAAFKLFDDAKAELEKCEVSTTRAAFADRLSRERKKAQILYGNALLEQCENDFNKLLLIADTQIFQVEGFWMTSISTHLCPFVCGRIAISPLN